MNFEKPAADTIDLEEERYRAEQEELERYLPTEDDMKGEDVDAMLEAMNLEQLRDFIRAAADAADADSGEPPF